MAMKPETRWELLNNTFEAYQEYRKNQGSEHSLSYVDLLYVSNFKGGNASVGDSRKEVEQKLSKYYQPPLKAIKDSFGFSKLQELTPAQYEELSRLAADFFKLTKDTDSKIRGFGVSWASALLAMNFPDLLPVLDRRVLAGAKIDHEVDKSQQVKKIERYYPALILTMHKALLSKKASSLRELDKYWFVKAK